MLHLITNVQIVAGMKGTLWKYLVTVIVILVREAFEVIDGGSGVSAEVLGGEVVVQLIFTPNIWITIVAVTGNVTVAGKVTTNFSVYALYCSFWNMTLSYSLNFLQYQ